MKKVYLLISIFLVELLSAQNPNPFDCSGNDGFGYYTSSETYNLNGSDLTYSNSRISKLTTSTGLRVTLCSTIEIGVALNGLAFNPHDNFLYAVSRYDPSHFSGKLFRIGENCQKIEIPVTGPIITFTTNNINTIDAAGGNISAGTFDLDNNYYVNTSFTNINSTGFTNKLQKISIIGDTATVLSTVTLTCPSCTGTNKLRVTDVIFDEESGSLYGSNKQTNKLYSINSANGVLTEIGSTGITSTILGMYKNRDGNVRAVSDIGNIYGVNLSTGSFTLLNNTSSLNSGNADAASGCYAPPYISGHLYIDANGLTDNTVNGIPSDKAGNTELYANLVQDGLIVKSSYINSTTGMYQFLGLYSGSYEIQISNTLGVIGQAAPLQNLPTNYIFTGENIGAGAGNDGTPDGKINVVIAGGNDITEVNFGINGLPTAVNITGPTVSNPGGTTQVEVPTLSINDPEENNINNITVQMIPNPSNSGTLYYDGIAVVADQFIADYVPSLLTFDPVDGNITLFFTYFTTDMAGSISNVANVNQDFTDTALPVELKNFTAEYKHPNVLLHWTTFSEINNDYFLVLKSMDGKSFDILKEVPSKNGMSDKEQNYFTEDKDANGLNYYKLKQVDLDGNMSYSKTISININTNMGYHIYPTVSDHLIYISTNKESLPISTYTILNSVGQVMLSGNLDDNFSQVSIADLQSGVYFIIITDQNQSSIQVKKFIRS